MTERGKQKPGEASKEFHIWGSDQSALRRYKEEYKEEHETRNDPTRYKRATKRDARTAELQRLAQIGMDKRYHMEPVKEREEPELSEEAA